ncbi:hypothetical protein KM043_008338 [Ampulex compressa]|nr:hypothetical protein KM043_008338 [Ampulex compressa]
MGSPRFTKGRVEPPATAASGRVVRQEKFDGARRRRKGEGAGQGGFGIRRRRTCWHMFRLKFPPAAPGVESLNLWGRAFRVRGTKTYTNACTREHTRADVRAGIFSPARKAQQWRSQYVNQFVPSAQPRTGPGEAVLRGRKVHRRFTSFDFDEREPTRGGIRHDGAPEERKDEKAWNREAGPRFFPACASRISSWRINDLDAHS